MIVSLIFDNYKKRLIETYTTVLNSKDASSNGRRYDNIMRDVNYFKSKLEKIEGAGNASEIIYETVSGLYKVEEIFNADDAHEPDSHLEDKETKKQGEEEEEKDKQKDVVQELKKEKQDKKEKEEESKLDDVKVLKSEPELDEKKTLPESEETESVSGLADDNQVPLSADCEKSQLDENDDTAADAEPEVKSLSDSKGSAGPVTAP